MTDDMEVRVDAWKVSGFGNLGQTWLSFLLRGVLSQNVSEGGWRFLAVYSCFFHWSPCALSPHLFGTHFGSPLTVWSCLVPVVVVKNHLRSVASAAVLQHMKNIFSKLVADG